MNKPTCKVNRTLKALVFLVGHANFMVRQCGWCKHILGFKRGGKGITHGICPKCVANLK